MSARRCVLPITHVGAHRDEVGAFWPGDEPANHWDDAMKAEVARLRDELRLVTGERDKFSGALDVMHAQQLRTENERDAAVIEVERLRAELERSRGHDHICSEIIQANEDLGEALTIERAETARLRAMVAVLNARRQRLGETGEPVELPDDASVAVTADAPAAVDAVPTV